MNTFEIENVMCNCYRLTVARAKERHHEVDWIRYVRPTSARWRLIPTSRDRRTRNYYPRLPSRLWTINRPSGSTVSRKTSWDENLKNTFPGRGHLPDRPFHSDERETTCLRPTISSLRQCGCSSDPRVFSAWLCPMHCLRWAYATHEVGSLLTLTYPPTRATTREIFAFLMSLVLLALIVVFEVDRGRQ